MVKRMFRPLGSRLQRFARLRINNFARITNMASRAAIAPTWEDAADEPLVWQSPVGATTPETDFEPDFEPEIEPDIQSEGDFSPRRTPPDLALILELHEERRREQGIAEPPSPFRTPGTPSAVPGAPIQREPDRPSPAPDAPPARPPTPPQRRGRVISEITPTAPPTDLPPVDEPVAESTPNWEAELDEEDSPPDDRPDLAEALISAGMMSPRPIQRDTEPPDYQPRPRRRNRARIEYEMPASPSAETPEQPAVESTDSTDDSDEPPPPIPPATPRAQAAPPTPADAPAPVQRRVQPAPPADPEADTLTPAPGSDEADMLDILGLPADTPVVGLNPAAAQPPTPAELSAPQPTSSETPPSSTPVSRVIADEPPALPVDDHSAETRSNRPVDAAPTPPAASTPPPIQRQSRVDDDTPQVDEPELSIPDMPEAPVEYQDSTPISEPPTQIMPPSPAITPDRPVRPAAPNRPTPPVQRQEQPGSIQPPPEDVPASQPPSDNSPPTPPVHKPLQREPLDDFEEFGDTQPIETLRDVESPLDSSPPGYHIAPPPIAHSTAPDQISRVTKTDSINPGKVDSGSPSSPAPFSPNPPASGPSDPLQGSKIGTPSPATSTSSSTPPPMGGKLGGKLGNDSMPGKSSAESPPGSVDPPAEQSSGGSPNGEMPQETQDALESLGFETDPFGSDNSANDNESDSSAFTSDANDEPDDTFSVDDSLSSGEDEGTDAGDEGDQPSNAEDAAEESGVNVDKLARDVFNVLRDRLRIEHERRSSR